LRTAASCIEDASTAAVLAAAAASTRDKVANLTENFIVTKEWNPTEKRKGMWVVELNVQPLKDYS
jgi:hypothetical protein